MDVKDWINYLGLQPHPEGGFYKETYRAEGLLKPEGLLEAGVRNYCTAIYFLLVDNNFSAFHKITSDEVWHFYAGQTLELLEIDPDGILRHTLIGNNPQAGSIPQYVVKGGNWFASRVMGGQGFCLVGCTVSPGFDFVDFELAERSALIKQYPQHRDTITALTR